MVQLVLLAVLASAAACSAVQLEVDTPWVLPPSTSTEHGGLAPSLSLALNDLRKDW